MNNGISLIIPNADFSNSPLGQVTILESAEERITRLVSSYISATGAAEDYDAVYSLVVGLMAGGLWDKCVAIYPILGDTLAKMSLNLKDMSLYPLQYRENASVGNKKMSFVNTIAISAPGTNYLQLNKTVDTGVFVKINKNTGLNGSHLLYTPVSLFSEGSPIRAKATTYQVTSVLATITNGNDYAIGVSYSTDGKIHYVINNEEVISETLSSTPATDNGWFRGGIGYSEYAYSEQITPGTTIEPNKWLFNGSCSYYIVTKGLGVEDVTAMQGILNQFCVTTGK